MAASVIHSLLDWIDRVDFASQCGMAPPPFQTPDGESIYPDEPWWLTDVQRKEEPKDEKDLAKGDEDGPASSENGETDLEDAPADDALTEDEDPLSDMEDARGVLDSQQPRIVLEHVPEKPGWVQTALLKQQQPTCSRSCSASQEQRSVKRKRET